MTPRECLPGAEAGALPMGVGGARIPHHLPGNRSCQIVGWRVFFFSLLGGGFLLASPWRWGALGSGSVPCFLRVLAPGVCGFLRPPGAQFRNMPSQTPHMLKMPALGGTEINSDFIWGKASTLSSPREQNVVKPCAHFMV